MEGVTTYPAILGRILREKRESLGLEQVEIAERIQISQPTWSRIERGEAAISLDQLVKAAKSFQMEPGELLSQADAAARGLRKLNYVVEDERGSKGHETALAVIGGAVLGFLIAKALSK